MDILIVEDDELKYRYLDKYIRSFFSNPKIDWSKSYQDGLTKIFDSNFDLILLDMSMHIYEKTAQETGGGFEPYAGRMILSEMDMNDINTKVIVVTGYDTYGDGKTLDTLKEELRAEFSDFYIDTVYFIASQDTWKLELSEILKNNYTGYLSSNGQGIEASILIVDDDDYKIKKVRNFVSTAISNVKICTARDQIEAQKHLAREKFDLLILDMQLPVRLGDNEPQYNGGISVLEELDIDDSYFYPDNIIALTQFDNLKNQLRNEREDLAVIKFDNSTTKWEEGIRRVLSRLLKSKQKTRKIVYCEGKNAELLNSLNLKNLEFQSLHNSRHVYLAAFNEKDRYSLRDRDFLTTYEIKKTQEQLPNYFILEYYCFENYLYHPDNIKEVIIDFDTDLYIEDLIKQKNEKFIAIIQDYKSPRNSYLEISGHNSKYKDKKPENEIAIALKSDDLEVFYPFFDMAGKSDKGHLKSYNKTYLSKFNLNSKDLAKTNWFRNRMMKIFNKIL